MAANWLTIYVHYGQHRTRDPSVLSEHDITLTTYGVLASEYAASRPAEAGAAGAVAACSAAASPRLTAPFADCRMPCAGSA